MNSLKSWPSRCYLRRAEVRRGFGSGVREALIYSAFAVGDSLAADPGDRLDLVLTNPPFGLRQKAGERNALSLDIFWLKDDSLDDSGNLPAPEILAQEINR